MKTYPVSLVFTELNVAMNSLATKLISDNKIAEAFTPVRTQATHTFLLTLVRLLTSSVIITTFPNFLQFFSTPLLTAYFSPSYFIKETEVIEGLC